MNRENPCIKDPLLPTGESSKCHLHTTHVGAIGWELYGSSTTIWAGKAGHGLVYVCPLLFKSLPFENSKLNCSAA